MDEKPRQFGKRRPAGVRNSVYPTAREVLLARLLLHLCDKVASGDEDQVFVELYDGVKAIAEPIVRAAGGER